MGIHRLAYISNIPFGATGKELKQFLQSYCPEGFHQEQFQVEISNQRNSTVTSAKISGFELSHAKWMKLTAQPIPFQGRFLRFKPDFGDERDEDGIFQLKMNPRLKHNLKRSLFGCNFVVVDLFNSTFLEELVVYKPYTKRLSLNKNIPPPPAVDKILAVPGYFVLVKRELDAESQIFTTRICYNTKMEDVQAIRFLNGHAELGEAQFYSRTSRNDLELCASKGNKGLGPKGTVLNIAVLTKEHGYIPLDKMDQTILIPTPQLNTRGCPRCFYCNSAFKVVGVGNDLNFFAAVCKGCTYEPNRNLRRIQNGIDSKFGICWQDERFTRLAVGSQGNLYIVHDCMQLEYPHPEEYPVILLPILRDDYEVQKKQLNQHGVESMVTKWNFIEKVDKTYPFRNTFVAEVVLEETKEFWNVEEMSNVRFVTCSVGRDELTPSLPFQTCIGRICRIKSTTSFPNPTKSLSIFIRLDVLSTPKSLHLIPKPDKSEYDSAKRIINLIGKGGISEEMDEIKGFSTRPILLGNASSAAIIPELCRDLSLEENTHRNRLNEYQLQAFNNAIYHDFSIIHGPPGCGKSFTIAQIALYLSHTESKKKVVIATPSNVAAELMSEMLMREASGCSDLGLPTKILRILSKQKEDQLVYSEPSTKTSETISEQQNNTCDTLHEQVVQNQEWKDLIAKFSETPYYMLPRVDLAEYEKQKSRIEQQVMENYDILIATTGCLLDQRIGFLETGTIIIDEAGQEIEPKTLAALNFKQVRTVLAGDPFQLSAFVNSFASETAGLDRSLLERMELLSKIKRGTSDIKLTLLRNQYRMPPQLGSLISKTFYDGELLNSTNQTSYEIPMKVTLAIPELLKHPIVVYNHGVSETRSGNSYLNTREITQIVKTVGLLINDGGVEANMITVLTMYEKQRERLSWALQQTENCSSIKVKNVDGYQGRENDYIIMSMVRSNSELRVGFTVKSNRVNVALSRAKKALIIVMDMGHFAKFKSQMIQNLINHLSEYSVIVKI